MARQNKAARALASARRSAANARARSRDMRAKLVQKGVIGATGYVYGRTGWIGTTVDVPYLGATPSSLIGTVAGYGIAMMTGGGVSDAAEAAGDASLAIATATYGVRAAAAGAVMGVQGGASDFVGSLEERLADELDDAIGMLDYDDDDDVGYDDEGAFSPEEELDGLAG